MGAGQCKSCAHPERETIDRLLAEGASLGELSRRFGMSKPALQRHRDGHVKARVAAAAAAREEAVQREAGTLLERLESLADLAEQFARLSATLGASHTPSAIREARETLIRYGLFSGELKDGSAEAGKSIITRLFETLEQQAADDGEEPGQ